MQQLLKLLLSGPNAFAGLPKASYDCHYLKIE
jgi:hypothetical protein